MRARRRNLGRRKRAGSARGLGGAIAAFLILCGVLLAWFGSGADDRAAENSEPQTDPVADHLLSGLEATQQAQRALERANYGDVRRHIERAQESLTWILAELHGSTGELED